MIAQFSIKYLSEEETVLVRLEGKKKLVTDTIALLKNKDTILQWREK